MYMYVNSDKNNKESPLFHNEHGLSPFEMIQLPEERYNHIEGNMYDEFYLAV